MNTNFNLEFQNIGLPEDILRRKMWGDFEGAIRLIDRRLADSATPKAMAENLKLQKEMIRLLPQEYPYTREDALSIIRDKIPEFTEEEFDELVDDRRIYWIYVNGEMRFFNRFFSSVCKAKPEFARRAGVTLPGVESAVQSANELGRLDINMQRMKAEGSRTNRIRIRATVKLKDEFFTPGVFVRAYLPIPAACQQQSDIKIEKVSPANAIIAPENFPQRTVCWEETLTENQEFEVIYSYLHTAKYTNAYEGTGIPGVYDFDLEEKAPHMVFTPYIRALCKELTEGMTDPLEKARAIYDFVTLKMQYTFMPSYLLLSDIADNCAKNHTGDCGVLALTFITLCRCAGIPAQWQSGMTAEPDFIGAHDWVRFYVEPYGWIFADPSYGTGAVRSNKELRRQFYFGNLDPFRMVANSEFQHDFYVPKKFMRADPYDNQLGEIETSDRGFTFDDYIRTKEILTCEEV